MSFVQIHVLPQRSSSKKSLTCPMLFSPAFRVPGLTCLFFFPPWEQEVLWINKMVTDSVWFSINTQELKNKKRLRNYQKKHWSRLPKYHLPSASGNLLKSCFLWFLLSKLRQVQDDLSRPTSWTQQDDFINSIHFSDQIVSPFRIDFPMCSFLLTYLHC